ncbi:MAG: helix-turn-helix domain-containing protein [Verrucomicrobiota bacterium]
MRPEQNWCVLLVTQGGRFCLQRLALRCGYRMGEMCAELECSERYFHEVCTRDIGLTPKEWLRWERIVVARRMLTGGRSPDEVAEVLGFSSRNNFRREFLAYHRIGPLEFQRRSWGMEVPSDQWEVIREEKRME